MFLTIAGILFVVAAINIGTYLNDKAYIEYLMRESEAQDKRVQSYEDWRKTVRDLERQIEDTRRRLGQ